MIGSHHHMPRVEGDVSGFKKGCDCALCTASEFTMKCWECACEGGKYKYKKNSFHWCRTKFEHTDMDRRQDGRSRQQGGEADGKLCTKCYSGHVEDPMLLCDGYVPRWILLKKKDEFSPFPFTFPPPCFAIPTVRFKSPDSSRDTQM